MEENPLTPFVLFLSLPALSLLVNTTQLERINEEPKTYAQFKPSWQRRFEQKENAPSQSERNLDFIQTHPRYWETLGTDGKPSWGNNIRNPRNSPSWNRQRWNYDAYGNPTTYSVPLEGNPNKQYIFEVDGDYLGVVNDED
jgi:hypothetical protein